MATLCPVMVCVATDKGEKKREGYKPGAKGRSTSSKGRTLDFSKGAFGDIANDGVLPEL